MGVGVGQQCQVPGTLHRFRQLALIFCFRPSNSTRDNLTRLTDIGLEQLNIFIIDFCNALGGEATILSSSKKSRHRYSPCPTSTAASVGGATGSTTPHGGGEGRSPIGRKRPITPWGKPALGVKTRKNNKSSDNYIIRRRK